MDTTSRAGFLAPMTAQAGELPTGPAARAFRYELKWDGIRALLHWDGVRSLRLASRTGRDVSPAFPELAPVGAQLGNHGAILDGEIVALDPRGRPDFGLLQGRLGRSGSDARSASRTVPAAMLFFDVLSLDGRDLTGHPYRQRRKRLRGLDLQGPAWTTPPDYADGAALLRTSQRLGFEGVVAKRGDSLYAPGRRSPDWIKVRNRPRQEFVIGGWVEGQGARRGTIGSLLLGHYDDSGKRLQYVGRVGSGLGDETLAQLRSKLREMAAPNPFGTPLKIAPDVHFVRPNLVAEVEFSGLTRERRLRQPAFRGLRADKPPRQVVWEQTKDTQNRIPAKRLPPRSPPGGRTRRGATKPANREA